MGTRYTGFQRAIASAYLLLIFAVLPIYMRDGFQLLGDAKYLFFRSMSLLFLTLWLLGAVVFGLRRWWRCRSHSPETNRKEATARLHYSSTDYLAISFAVVSGLSYLFSPYKDTAFVGYSGWYMGLLTQLLLVGGYFLVSRWYESEKLIAGMVWASAFAVCLLGVLNRMGHDPLGVFGDMSWWDWDRRNLLSTIGNINWYCSYLAVVVPLLLYCFWAAGGWKRIPAGAAAIVGVAAVFLQGSNSGYMALAVMYGVLLFASLKDMGLFLRFLETLLLVPLFCFTAWLVELDLILPYDMEANVGKIYTPLWGIALGILALGILACRMVHRRSGKNVLESGRVSRAAGWLAIPLAAAFGLVFVGCQVSDDIWRFFGSLRFLRFDEEWGSMRGGVWRAAWKSFRESSLACKLYGVGPDCFARYLYEHESFQMYVSGQWQDAVYANAHNEWLNMLVNEGVLGLAAYLGFFLSAFGRFWRNRGRNPRMTAGMMAIAAYLVNNFFSFGQVVSTPLIFLVIAVCEKECRNAETGKDGTDGRE